MPFAITVLPAARRVEVVYPAEPTPRDVAEYLLAIKKVMDEIAAPWFCLVDQRALASMPEKLLEQIRTMNEYAVRKGMVRSARLVKSVFEVMENNRMAQAAQASSRSFYDRDEALRWLHGGG